ncbi:MAG: excinuclease ABC subunit UvrC, partial [Chitinophagaceae bacterium]
SYFGKNPSSWKTRELVARIKKIEFTIVDTEQDAFFLENALIKEHQPRFNIDLKDDKTYPFIVIKKEPFPRIFLTRKKMADGSEYLGPFTSVGRVRELLDFIRTLIPLRTCKLNLSDNNIQKKKYKVCLEYHLGNCKGPCEGLQSPADYESDLTQIRNLLKGNLGPVIRQFTTTMNQYAQQLAFEKAEQIRKKLDHLESYRAHSVIVGNEALHADIFALERDQETAFVSCLMVANGTIIQTHTVTLQPKLEETDAEVLSFAIAQLRSRLNSTAQEIIIPFSIDYPDPGVTLKVPRSGNRKKLLALAEKNARFFGEEVRRKKSLHIQEKTTPAANEVLVQVQEDLQLPETPLHIECFDNSHFQGSYPVSAMVCFKNGLPSKSDYRRFNTKDVQGINDVAAMKEVVFRRYRRLLDEQQPLPQLIIIDGGKGQLNAAMESIATLGLTGRMTV